MTMIVGGVTKAGRPMPGARAGRGQPGFAVGTQGSAPPAAPVAPAALAALDGMLALQEAETDAARDRRARKHGTALLDALAGLQLALLHGAGDPDALARLQALAERPPDAADPHLAGILAAIVLRARVELARRAPPPQ